jgi:PPOX class probable F420-dependent enzyme
MDLGRALDAARATNRSVLVTVRRDGRPQLSNVVHQVGADGLVRVSTTADRAKFHNLRRTPWAALKVDGETFWSYAVLEGDVTLSEVAELVDLYRNISGEHPDWDDYRRAMVEEHRVVVRIKPTYAYGAL